MASLITNEKPQSVEDFKKWLKTIIPSFSSEKAESYYKLAISGIVNISSVPKYPKFI